MLWIFSKNVENWATKFSYNEYWSENRQNRFISAKQNSLNRKTQPSTIRALERSEFIHFHVFANDRVLCMRCYAHKLKFSASRKFYSQSQMQRSIYANKHSVFERKELDFPSKLFFSIDLVGLTMCNIYLFILYILRKYTYFELILNFLRCSLMNSKPYCTIFHWIKKKKQNKQFIQYQYWQFHGFATDGVNFTQKKQNGSSAKRIDMQEMLENMRATYCNLMIFPFFSLVLSNIVRFSI